MIKKLEIIGPYTEDHEEPFCTRDGRPVEILSYRARGSYPVVGQLVDSNSIRTWTLEGEHYWGEEGNADLMNAREVRVPREVWLPQFENGTLFGVSMNTKEKAEVIREANGCARLIHFREVIDAAREVG